MATDLETRKSSSKSDAFLQRKFAELCARIRRVDLLGHLLVLLLAILIYALLIGTFDWFTGNATAAWIEVTRWIGFSAFAVVAGFCVIQTIRCLLRPVSPYYVAQQIEASLPNARNALINWLDMRDEELPGAFQRNLSARAAEQLETGDVERTVKKRKNWVLLGMASVPALGLIILMVLGLPSFAASMMRAFAPFYTPAPIARTQITLLQPEGGDAEVSAAQAVTFSARIEGRVPTGNRPDAPKLAYRYQKNEDWFTQALQQDAAGAWTTQLPASQLRAGIAYKITAGDAETPEHQVRVRGRAHVKQFEVTYRHRAFRKLPKTTTAVFPNKDATRPVIHGPGGSDVELVIRPSRPMQKSSVEIETAAGKQELPIRKLPDGAIACAWTLEQSGRFRVLFTTADGEDNADRDWCPIDVAMDETPRVVLAQPGQDVSLPETGTLDVRGHASSDIGVKSMTLHVRPVGDPNMPKRMSFPYRAGKSFAFDDGTFPAVIEYLDIVPLDQLKDEKGIIRRPVPGSVLEYWLEATDASDFPNKTGNIGKSAVYKVLITPAPKDSAQQEVQRKNALDQKKKHDKQQDDKHQQENKDRSKNQGGTNDRDPQQGLDDLKKENKDTENKIKQALKEKEEQDKKGGAKPAEQKNSDAKDGPQKGPDDPQPSAKGKSPDENAGDQKDKGDSKGDAGKPRDDGAKDTKSEPQAHGDAKGIEKNGPDVADKNGKSPQGPPNAKEKSSAMNDAGAKKNGPDPAKQPGTARGDDPKKSDEPTFDEIANLIAQLPNRDGKGDDAGQTLAAIAQKSNDSAKRDLAAEALVKNGRDPKTGRELKKGPNPAGLTGNPKTPGLTDDIKAAAANREFAAKIAQLQLDDWKKRLTPELRKKAGISDVEWERYVNSMKNYDALVRALNAKIAQQALKELHGGTAKGVSLTQVQGNNSGNATLSGAAPAPPDLRDVLRRFNTPPKQ